HQVAGPGGTNPYWDQVTDSAGNEAGWLADVWLDTGADINTQVEPCAGTTEYQPTFQLNSPSTQTLGTQVLGALGAASHAADGTGRTVDGTVVASENLAVKTAPSLSAQRAGIGLLPFNHTYTVACYRDGDEVSGDYGTNRHWDLIVDPADRGRAVGYVADVWLNTGGDITTQVDACGDVTIATGPDSAIPGPHGSKDVPTAHAVKITSSASTVTGPEVSCYVGRHIEYKCLAPIAKIDLVAKHAAAADIDPRLVLTILMREENSFGYGRPAEDIKLWFGANSRGLGNMHESTFNDTKAKHPDVFGDKQWADLTGDDELSIKATAWYLHDLHDQLPATWSGDHPRDELLAIGYNAGAENMQLIADGTPPGEKARNYVNGDWANSYGVNSWWSRADELICRSGLYLCH
ncbi:hypothetical protein AB0M47_39185, partial [Hamadaea sp. NPDC051192]|uniref:hypothetical protein n=1 Tax=Hamadaea sp. NPDC051192 TaxID=3154940 RepID=UPI0034423F96